MLEMLSFRSPIKLEGIKQLGFYSDSVKYEDLEAEVRGELFTNMRNYLDEDVDSPRFGKGLASYLPEDMGLVVLSVMLDFIEVDGELYTELVCVADKELNDNEIESLKEELIEQLSDGFGEGFEQHEFEVSYESTYAGIYASLWSSDHNWDLELVKRTSLY